MLLDARARGCSSRVGLVRVVAGSGVRVPRFGHCGITRSFPRANLCGVAILAGGALLLRIERKTVMKDVELKQVLRSLTKALDDPRFGPDRKIMLRKAKRIFEEMAQAGKFDKTKVYRAVDLMATAFLESEELPQD
jgi:hypothetical protein